MWWYLKYFTFILPVLLFLKKNVENYEEVNKAVFIGSFLIFCALKNKYIKEKEIKKINEKIDEMKKTEANLIVKYNNFQGQLVSNTNPNLMFQSTNQISATQNVSVVPNPANDESSDSEVESIPLKK